MRSRHSRRAVTHESLGDGVRPWRPDRSLDDPDALCGQDRVEGSAELCVSVTDEELDRVRLLGELQADVAGLLGHPVSGRLGGHAGDPVSPDVVVDEEEHVEPAEQHGVDAEEVAIDQALRLSGEDSAQVGPDRRGESSVSWRFRIARTLDAAIGMPMLANSP